MAKVIISTANDSRVYEYDSVMKNVKSHARKDTSFRCYDKMAMRIDIFPNTIYHRSYHITEQMYEKIKLQCLKDKKQFRSEKVMYGVLIADATKGYSKSKDFLYNALVTQKYDKPYILDTMNIYYNNGVMRCIPHGSEKSTFNKTLFNNIAGDTYTKIREIMGIPEGIDDVTNFATDRNLPIQGVYAGACSFDVDGMRITELFEVGRVII